MLNRKFALRRIRLFRISWILALAGVPLLDAQAATPAASADQKSDAPCWRYERMRPADLAEALRTKPVAWLAFSPLEWHGEAIAFCSDPIVAQTVVQGAWRKVGGVLLPTLYLGVERDYNSWNGDQLVHRWGMEYITKQHNPGSIYLQPLTLELVLRDMLTALARENFKVCVLMTGHLAMDQLRVLEDVAQRKYGDMKVVPFATLSDDKVPEALQFPGASMHASFDELSLVGSIDRSLVDPDVFGVNERDRSSGLHHEDVDKIDFAKARAAIDYNIEQLATKVTEALSESGR